MSSNQYESSGSELPGYDSVAYQPDAGKGHATSLSAILQAAVQNRLTNLLLEQIHPLLHSQVASGIYRMAFILIPSDVFGDDNDGLKSPYYDSTVPADELQTLSLTPIEHLRFVKMVKLKGEENNSQFLTQPQVIKLLKSQLIAHLCPERAQREEEERSRAAVSSPPPPPTSDTPKSPKKSSKSGLLSWKRTPKRSSSVSETDVKAEMREVEVAPVDRIDVRVTREEICVRRMTTMGLYETRSGEGIVVHVNFSG